MSAQRTHLKKKKKKKHVFVLNRQKSAIWLMEKKNPKGDLFSFFFNCLHNILLSLLYNLVHNICSSLILHNSVLIL